MTKLEIRHRIVGAMPEDVPANTSIDLLNEQLTVGELITQTVQEQIRDLLINLKLDAVDAQKILNRQYLTDEDVERQANAGKVRLPNASTADIPVIAPETEVKKALAAFKRKTYLIVVDGQQVEDLDEVLTLRANSKITFVRLTPLVGG